MTKPLAMTALVRAGLVLSIVLGLQGVLHAPSPVLAQAIISAEVHGINVSLRDEPDKAANMVAVLQQGDAIRITGDAANRHGRTEAVTVATLGARRAWFVPVEVVATGDVGWVAEVFVFPRAMADITPVARAPAPVETQAPPPIPAPVETQVPTVAPVPTATQLPTVAPVPTATQVSTLAPAPTATQVPPAAPTPTATRPPIAAPPRQGMTLEETAYISAMMPITTSFSGSLGRTNEVMGLQLLGDASWEASLQVEVDVRSELFAQAQAITPPQSLSEIHTTFLSGISYIVDGDVETMLGVHTLDSDALDRAILLVEKGSREIVNATNLLIEFSKERGISEGVPSTSVTY